MRCKICNRECKTAYGLSRHVQGTHKINAKDYYDTYNSTENNGKCLTCGQQTAFVNLIVGYRKFCCNRCVGLNKDIQQHKINTMQEHYGVDYPTQSKEIQQKITNVLKSTYNVSNAFNIGLDKSMINSHTDEANLKRGKSLHKTKSKLMQNDEYKQSVINKAIQTNLEKHGVEWPSNLDSVKQKISDTVKSKNCQDRTKQTCMERYNVPHHTQSRHYIEKAKKKYLYNNTHFDSSWELALYIYAIDHNMSIIREPCTLFYFDNNNIKHSYTPDFLFNNELIEIKGNQFFDKDGNLINIYTKKIETAKLNCINKNNVKLLKYDDIKCYIDYCIQKYNKNNPWYEPFKNV